MTSEAAAEERLSSCPNCSNQPEGKNLHANKLSPVAFPLWGQHAHPWHTAAYLSQDKVKSKAILHIRVTFFMKGI